jgi:8-oxo-dGTP diphosphatase
VRGTTNIPSCYVLIRKGDMLLFVLREKTGYMDGCYSLPAGHVEAGENFSRAAAREALEEVNVTVDPKFLNHAHTMHRLAGNNNVRVDIFFETDQWSGKPKNMESPKHSGIEWLQANQLPDNVMDYQAHALKQIALGNSYSELG